MLVLSNVISLLLISKLISALPSGSFLSSALNDKDANLTITVWGSDAGCPKATALNSNNFPLAYGSQSIAQIMSYTLSRALKVPDEQLDFSMQSSKGPQDTLNVQCDQFLEKANPDSNGNPLKANTCYQLTHSGGQAAGVSQS